MASGNWCIILYCIFPDHTMQFVFVSRAAFYHPWSSTVVWIQEDGSFHELHSSGELVRFIFSVFLQLTLNIALYICFYCISTGISIYMYCRGNVILIYRILFQCINMLARTQDFLKFLISRDRLGLIIPKIESKILAL